MSILIHQQNNDKVRLKKMKCSKISISNLSRINEIEENSNSQRIYVFQQRMKSLNFAIVIFKSNIIFVITQFTQFLKNSNSNHVTIANRVIVYVNDIKNFVIEFSKNSSEIFLCANDVAFADDELIKKNLNNYFFKLYDDSID